MSWFYSWCGGWKPLAAGLMPLSLWEEINVARALSSLLSARVRGDVFLVGRYSLVPQSYHHREFVITAQLPVSDC